jgi:hypothetical protein
MCKSHLTLSPSLETRPTISVPCDGVVASDFGLGRDNTLTSGLDSFLEKLGLPFTD